MNQKMIKFFKIGCIICICILGGMTFSISSEYLRYYSLANNAVSFEDYHYAFENQDYMLMAEFTTMEQADSKGVDNRNYYNFGVYYRLMHSYLATSDEQIKYDLLQQMKDIVDDITFVTVKETIDKINSIYLIPLD